MWFRQLRQILLRHPAGIGSQVGVLRHGFPQTGVENRTGAGSQKRINSRVNAARLTAKEIGLVTQYRGYGRNGACSQDCHFVLAVAAHSVGME